MKASLPKYLFWELISKKDVVFIIHGDTECKNWKPRDRLELTGKFGLVYK